MSNPRLSRQLVAPGLRRRQLLAALGSALGAALLAGRPGAAWGERGAPPVYPTRLPPPATLHYALRRGPLAGSGRLVWKPHDHGYEMRLEGSVLGLDVLTQVSRGGIDAAGLAPLRFTDKRLRRPLYVADFERESARVRFSPPRAERVWRPGVQDRLSWMIQLSAIAAADAQRIAPGAQIELLVIGARGESATWVFASRGHEALDTPAGRIDTVHLRRETQGKEDESGVEVWLDPGRHLLPVRATMREGDAVLELRLREMLPGT